jgi:hypothetical protein
MPIAQQDAGTFARAGEFNTAARNTASLTNAGFSNDAARYNTSARNDALAQQRSAGIQGEQTAQQRAEAAAARSFQSSEREASQNFQAAQQKIQNEFTAYQQELERQGMDSRQAQQLAMQESLAKMQEAGVQNRFDAELALKSTQFDAAQAADDRRLAQQHANTLEQMGYANSLNTANVPSTFAASISSTTMNQVNAILADPNLDPTAKKNAVDNVVNYANSTIAWAEKFYNTTLPYILPPTNQSQVAPTQQSQVAPTQATTTQPQAADQTLNKVPSVMPTEYS